MSIYFNTLKQYSLKSLSLDLLQDAFLFSLGSKLSI